MNHLLPDELSTFVSMLLDHPSSQLHHPLNFYPMWVCFVMTSMFSKISSTLSVLIGRLTLQEWLGIFKSPFSMTLSGTSTKSFFLNYPY